MPENKKCSDRSSHNRKCETITGGISVLEPNWAKEKKNLSKVSTALKTCGKHNASSSKIITILPCY